MAYQFKTTNVKGKQYVEVTERVKYFRLAPEYKGWSIDTEIISMDGGEVVMKTTIKDSEGIIKSTGLAHEVQEASYINKTSYIENCETSAVGRALAMLAIGIDTSMASADEVEIAIAKDQEGITGKKTATKPVKTKSPEAKPSAVKEISENEKSKQVIQAVNYIMDGKTVPERNERKTIIVKRMEFTPDSRQSKLLEGAVTGSKS